MNLQLEAALVASVLLQLSVKQKWFMLNITSISHLHHISINSFTND